MKTLSPTYHFIFTVISLVFCFTIETGCSGLSMSELSDARTLPKNTSALEINFGRAADVTKYSGYIPEEDKKKEPPRVVTNSNFNYIELGYKYGILDNMDVRFNVWSTNFPFNFAFDDLYSDYGLKLGTKLRLTPKENSHHFAILTSASLYKIELDLFDDPSVLIMNSWSVGMVYSYTISEITEADKRLKRQMDKVLDKQKKNSFGKLDNRIRSFYLGFKKNYTDGKFNRYESANGDLVSVRHNLTRVPFLNIYAGITFGLDGQFAFEIQNILAKNNLTGKTEGFFTYSFGTKIFF